MNTQKGFAPIVALLMVLGVIVVGGVGYTFIKKSEVTENKPAIQEAQLPKEEAQQLKNEITDWNTYRNEKYGFEFRYPKTIVYKDNGDSNYKTSITEDGVSTDIETNTSLQFQITEKEFSSSPFLSIEFKPAMFYFRVTEKPKNFISIEEYQKQLDKEAEEETNKYMNEAAAGFSAYTTTTQIGSNEVIEKTKQDQSAVINTEKEFIFEGKSYLFGFTHENFSGIYLWGLAPKEKADGDFQSYLLLQEIMKTFRVL